LKTSLAIKMIICVLICLGVGFAGSFFTAPAIDNWYAQLEKPAFNPPNWLFAPVWTLLYITMGISAALIWNIGLDSKAVKIALTVFVFQLILNFLWTPLFFGLHLIAAALAEIIVLLAALAVTIYHFSRLSKTAALLLVPYLLWTSFAALLNAGLWSLNR